MEQLVRSTLELEQYECGNCERLFYISVMDRKKNDQILCPYGCSPMPYHGAGNHIRTLITEVKKVIDINPKVCPECNKKFIPTWDNTVLCKECLDKEYYIKQLKKPDDIIEVHKTLENIFGE